MSPSTTRAIRIIRSRYTPCAVNWRSGELSQTAHGVSLLRIPTSGSGCSVVAVEERLQHHLSRDLIEPLLLLLATDFGLLQIQLGHRRRVSFIPKHDRQPAGESCPLAEGPRLASFRPFVAAHVNRQTNDQTDGLILGGLPLQERLVFGQIASRVIFQRTGNRLIGGRDRNANSLRAIIQAQQRAASRDRSVVSHDAEFQGLLNSRKWRDCRQTHSKRQRGRALHGSSKADPLEAFALAGAAGWCASLLSTSLVNLHARTCE